MKWMTEAAWLDVQSGLCLVAACFIIIKYTCRKPLEENAPQTLTALAWMLILVAIAIGIVVKVAA